MPYAEGASLFNLNKLSVTISGLSGSFVTSNCERFHHRVSIIHTGRSNGGGGIPFGKAFP